MINALGVVEKVYKSVGIRCSECDGIIKKWSIDDRDSRPRFADEIPRIDPRKMRCRCQSEDDEPPYLHEPYAEFANGQRIVLFDTETFNDLESLNVILLDDYTKNVQSGEQIAVTGSLQKITRNNKTLAYLYVGLNPIEGAFECLNKKESVRVSDEDEKEVMDFLAQN